ncbi:hypothetical protein H5410_002294 [Solanum commersonii]|uniref:Ubiquitin-like protease family profile domain-containing protein n=1 Tax=Solanum commersonii TaxID=4109 RepID=A0A9J6B1J8_SOLCO|nr:hypothetical protein H5410_002294 [Solanum commersonii]
MGDILKNLCKGEMPIHMVENGMEQKEFTVMNIKNTHFIALEVLMEKGLIQVYDCNIHIPFSNYGPNYSARRDVQSFMRIFLNDAWSYERLKNVPSNNSRAACGPYALFFIDHLLLGKDMRS